MEDSLADDFYQLLVQQYIGVAVTALVAYEFFITFAQEVETVWRRKLSVTSLLVVTTRWVLLLTQITSWLASWPKSCKPDIVLNDVLVAVGYLQVALFSALRAFALSSRNYTLFIVVFMFGLVPVWTDAYNEALSTYTWLDAPFNTCIASPHFSQAKYGMLVYVTRSFLVAADVVVLIVTWAKTYHQWREARRIHVQLSMSTCLLRDGTIYFAILLAMNIAHMATYNTVAAPMSTIINTLPGILIVRFMFNLRALDGSSAESSSAETPSQFSDANFAVPSEYLGNIGAALDHWQSSSTTAATGTEASDHLSNETPLATNRIRTSQEKEV